MPLRWAQCPLPSDPFVYAVGQAIQVTTPAPRIVYADGPATTNDVRTRRAGCAVVWLSGDEGSFGLKGGWYGSVS
eukprot:13073706-Alexandrium_andersonii.AAC.1